MTTTSLAGDTPPPLPAMPRLKPLYRMQWEPVQNAHVLLYPEGMVKLNASAAAILALCDGSRSPQDIVAALQAQYPNADLAQDVLDWLRTAQLQGWLI
ncbi:hypothetical protein AAV94_11370 [Lampropedia cohaerens]|uniref:Pyrroloquinoline quinone biosynthesis protein PqqD n=1 Tax=Lampropedia cohaerens TaxID=1610491 RepID=A0A0U1PY77_9BURK|nr:pyrroloquinoline quinone biosynthesis peptide chaperone PqqD [Lampropedia cohaerens]KKW67421.1 hypothetical protein AAV94_11370 [Lampropedia cohaerens]